MREETRELHEAASLNDLADRVRARMPVILLTVLGFTDGGRTMTRLWSSHPDDYPVGGEKDVAADVAPDWIAAAVDHQQPFFGKDRADLRRIFADHRLIESLGCGSIINAPIVDAGVTIAALNVLAAEGDLSDEHVPVLVGLAAEGRYAARAALAQRDAGGSHHD